MLEAASTVTNTTSQAKANQPMMRGLYRLMMSAGGSTGTFDPATSDIDFIVDLGDYEPGVTRRFLRFADAMAALLGRKVDLITDEQI